MEEREINQILKYIIKNEDNEGLAIWDIITKKFNEEKLEELLERGLIYEPVLGYIRRV